MSVELGQPPMVEALCEFFFEGEWDWTIPGRFYAQVAADYPEQQEKQVARLRVGESEAEVGGADRIILLNLDHSRAVQIGKNWLGVHRMPPYGDWTGFKTQIEQTLALYREIAAPEKLLDVNLYFRHHIRLPVTGVPLAPLLPQFPADTQLGYGSWMTWNQTIDVDRRDKRGIARLDSGAFFDPVRIPPRFVVVDVQRGVSIGVMLNLQFGFSDDKTLEWEELDSWLHTAHEELTYLWAHSVSEKMWQLPKEKNDEDT